MKNLKNLGKSISKKEQRAISGGQFCVIHCYAECLESGQEQSFCTNHCTKLNIANGGGF